MQTFVQSYSSFQNYTVDRMARMADEFFSSMGLFPANDAFWENSMLERPDDGRDVVCHASAWDLSNRVDFTSVLHSHQRVRFDFYVGGGGGGDDEPHCRQVCGKFSTITCTM